MKKLIGAFYFALAMSSLNAQVVSKNVKVVGSFDYGLKEITSFLEESSGCIRKSSPHEKGIFVSNEIVQIEIDENKQMAEVFKPNLAEKVYATKQCSNILPATATDGKMLIFSTVEDYEKIIETSEDATQEEVEIKYAEFLNTISGLNYPKFEGSPVYDQLVNSGVVENYPTLILKMLNQDGAIQIGNFVFRLDFMAEKVYVLPVVFKTVEYAKLTAGETILSHVTKYPWESEVVYDVHDVLPKIGCSENAAPTAENKETYTEKIEWTFLLDYNIFTGEVNASVTHKKFDAELKAKYRWTPIGWDLYTKVVVRQKTQTGGFNGQGAITWSANWVTADVPLYLVTQRRYKVKCKDDTGYSNAWAQYGNGIATGQSYTGLKALTKYWIGANAYAVIDGQWYLMNFGTPDNYVPYTGNSFQVAIKSGY